MQPNQERFLFRVRGCYMAHIALGSSFFGEAQYEVVLGDDRNRESVIKDYRYYFALMIYAVCVPLLL